MRSTGIIAFTAIVGASLLPSLASAHSNSNGLANHRRVLRRTNGNGFEKKAKVDERSDGAWETYAEAVFKRGGEVKKYKKRGGKTCRVRTPSAESASATASATSTGADGPTVIAAVLNPAASTGTGNAAGGWGQNAGPETSLSSSYVAPTTTYSSYAEVTTTAAAGSGGVIGGLLNVIDGTCGGCGASDAAPNGSPDWLNCGLYGGGWTPPHVTAKQLVSVDAHSHPEVFGACSQYADIFIDAANQYGVPATLLMAIGMQESGCNRDAQGARGEQGIMQVAGNACTQSDCKEPWYNIHRGASILVDDKLGGDVENGNIIQALGQYNGWMPGMQVGWGAQYGPSGQTIAYLDDMLNKWMQGKNAYA